ncbi:hypothetical protein SMQE08_26800 [Serratia marcescens]|nr:hypothetical protein SMQE08_26800 [Serratia marcescens]
MKIQIQSCVVNGKRDVAEFAQALEFAGDKRQAAKVQLVF